VNTQQHSQVVLCMKCDRPSVREQSTFTLLSLYIPPSTKKRKITHPRYIRHRFLKETKISESLTITDHLRNNLATDNGMRQRLVDMLHDGVSTNKIACVTQQDRCITNITVSVGRFFTFKR